MVEPTLLEQARSTLAGDSVSAELARRTFPVLVRQAGGAGLITYGELAAELVRHHRGMDHALGAVGRSVHLLGRSWREAVPPLEALVVFGGDRLPRNGVDDFLLAYFGINARQLSAHRAAYCGMAAERVQSYRRWPDVLAALGLQPLSSLPSAITLGSTSEREFSGRGEGPEHRALRLWLVENPGAIGLRGWSVGETEVNLPSGDRVDVLFRKGRLVRAVEVKSRISKPPDIARGLYQCVKYRAVLSLEASFNGRADEVESLLVLERDLPTELISLRNHLAVTCRKVQGAF